MTRPWPLIFQFMGYEIRVPVPETRGLQKWGDTLQFHLSKFSKSAHFYNFYLVLRTVIGLLKKKNC